MTVRQRSILAPERFRPRRNACIELTDCTTTRIPVSEILAVPDARDPQPLEARLAEQFLRQNRGVLDSLGVASLLSYDGRSVAVRLESSTTVGAIPLQSPTSGQNDYGLIVRPRFGWAGIGSMLGQMGWRVLPTPLRLPMLPTSERRVPPWVLSTIVLFRVEALLKQLSRSFDYVEADAPAPRGTINWESYSRERIPFGRLADVPCRYPELQTNRTLRAAIHFVLLKQHASLDGQRSASSAVVELLAKCESLLSLVRDVPPRPPRDADIVHWLNGPLRARTVTDGVEALQWTVDDRGLAGLADLAGLPWALPMETFFEGWVETVASQIARRSGGRVRSGRERATLAPLAWEPPFVGSQRYLLPDVVLERPAHTIVFDAKYKEHFEELNEHRWFELRDDLQERHRDDLLQVLAYSTLYPSERVTCCLAYPCRPDTWDALRERGRVAHRASVGVEGRSVTLVLCAMPMGRPVADVVDEIEPLLR